MVRLARFLTSIAVLACASLPSVEAQDHSVDRSDYKVPPPNYSPYAGDNFPSRVLWGDTHHHTSYSADAGMIGCILGPEQSYRFARGEEVTSNTGLPVKLSRPLDFLVVSDHSENLGVAPMIAASDPALLRNPTGRKWHDMVKGGKGFDAFLEWVAASGEGKDPINDPAVIRTAWDQIIAMAERYNEPGRFTALHGFEWTSMPGGNNLHRVVIFRDGADRVSRVLPMSQFDSTDPEELWKYLMVYEEKTGGRALGIPHNGNLSNGLMFAVETRKGQPFDRAYAERRSRFEPLVEVTQPKGDGETHPLLSPTDEFAAFERWDQGNVGGTAVKEPGMHQFEYARSALKLGLRLEQQLGVNPFKFGMIGSTDTHTALSTIEEENYFGKIASVEPNAHRFEHPAIRYPQDPKKTILAWQLQAAGLAAVWARENTRESIWDALERKEVYGTTGSRPTVRFFGGWGFEPQDAKVRRPATVGYRKGVPMGGDLPVPEGGPGAKAPTFLVAAAKDPYNGNLDRIQIVKGWLDGKGELNERVYDVAWSGDRKPDPKTGKLPSVRNTVDVANAIWTNTIGSPELIAVWKDPAFDATQRAFYYARVIEIPTPRWTAYDAKHFGIKMPPEVTMITQERAYTSPIWYTPGR